MTDLDDHREPSAAVSTAEWDTRVQLAACYRLVAHFGWDDVILTHISARVPGTSDAFLLNPYGLTFDEVTASNLVKVDVEGTKVEPSPYPVNPAGFVIHSAIHTAAVEPAWVIHLHTRDGVAVSTMEDGLLPLDQASIGLQAQLAYHEYEGPALDRDERVRLQRDLGDRGCMILRNHGTLTVGRTAAEAFMRMYSLERACTVQVRALAAGSRLHQPDPAAVAATLALVGGAMVSDYRDLAWAALLRRLDRIDAGYRA